MDETATPEKQSKGDDQKAPSIPERPDLDELQRRYDQELATDQAAAQKRDAMIVKRVARDAQLAEEEASHEYRLKRMQRKRVDQILEALAASAPAEEAESGLSRGSAAKEEPAGDLNG